MVERLIAAGDLPHLARLRGQTGLGRVATTRPAQTPVAWSTFATGLNPGGHGVFDFIRRDPASYFPELALNHYEQKNAFLPPKVVNGRRGVPVWSVLAEAGRGASIVRCPCTYPPDRVQGSLLAGMGVPDVRGGLGTPAFYTTDSSASPRESEHLIVLEPGPSGIYSTRLIGPRDPKTRGDTQIKLVFKLDARARVLTIESEGTPGVITVREGEYSGWLKVKFKLGLLQSVRGLVRFHLAACEPELKVHATAVQFDPAAPPFPISEPPDYAARLAGRIGLFHTAGMVEEHTALNNERISEDAFLNHAEIAWNEREAMLIDALERHEDGLFYCLFDTPDRVQHMFWRYLERDHPAHRGEPFDSSYASVIDDCYRRADRVVGKALEFVDSDTLFIALSDHGFTSFRRGVNLNTWLLSNGFLALKPGVEPGPEAGDLLKGVDWGRTRAFALGLGGIYLNVKGREGQGIVEPSEVEAVKAELARGLGGLMDPRDGQTAIRRLVPREQAYTGPFTADAPDLLVDFAPGYRVSWSSSLGGVARDDLEDNTKKWSGDHIIDPSDVPGVLLMNRAYRQEGARLVDLAPTILEALGVPAIPAMEGRSLLS